MFLLSVVFHCQSLAEGRARFPRRVLGFLRSAMASRESKLGLCASAGAERSPRATAFISSRSDSRL